MRPNIAAIARDHFDPYRWRSGTERLAPLLHAMIRMMRPKSVVECGAGYTTLFILEALEENVSDFEIEKDALLDKTARLGALEQESEFASWKNRDFVRWFSYQGRASTANPQYYLEAYEPRLYCFEKSARGSSYVQKIRRAVTAAGLMERLSLIEGSTVDASNLPPQALPIDLLWWDGTDEDGCGSLWPLVRSDGGVLILHNVASGVMDNWDFFRETIDTGESGVETIVLPQPNKLDQNSCAIIRKTDGYRPPYEDAEPARQLDATRKLRDELASKSTSKSGDA